MERIAAACAAARRARSRAPSGAGTPPRSGTTATRPMRAIAAGERAGDVVAVEQDAARAWACRNLVSRLKHVVLPAPFGPISAWMVWRRTFRLTFLTATKPLNSLVSPWASRIVCCSAISSPRGAATKSKLRRDVKRPVLSPASGYGDPGIQHGHGGCREIADIARDDGHAMDHCGCRDVRVAVDCGSGT